MDARVRNIILNRRAGDIALQTIVANGTPAFYLPDPNPALRMPSGLRRGYQDFANTPVTVSTQTAALALDLSEGAAIGAELITNGTFDSNVSGWSPFSAGVLAHTGSAMSVTCLTADSRGGARQSISTVANALYRITLDIVSVDDGWRLDAAGSTLVADSDVTGSFVYYFRASGASSDIVLYSEVGGASPSDVAVVVDNISVKRIAGYHFYQAASADEPTLNLTSGLYGYLGDGTSKHFRTGLVPASSMTMMAAVTIGAAAQGDTIIGADDGSGSPAFYIKVHSTTGVIAGGVGALGEGDVSGGSDVRGTSGIAALVANGTTAQLYWKPIGGALQTLFDDTYSGSIETVSPLYFFGRNRSGSVITPFAGTGYRAIGQQSAWTSAEVAAVANQWDRQLAALAA